MARRFVKVAEEEFEEAFFNPSDLVNTKIQLSPQGGVNSGGYIYTETRPPLFTSPWRIVVY